MKLPYKPVGVLVGVAGGMAASALVRKMWSATGDGAEPRALDADSTWTEIALVAAVEGAVFGLVKALVDRAGAVVYQRATGDWPD